jgi:hypothetical protein
LPTNFTANWKSHCTAGVFTVYAANRIADFAAVVCTVKSAVHAAQCCAERPTKFAADCPALITAKRATISATNSHSQLATFLAALTATFQSADFAAQQPTECTTF